MRRDTDTQIPRYTDTTHAHRCAPNAARRPSSQRRGVGDGGGGGGQRYDGIATIVAAAATGVAVVVVAAAAFAFAFAFFPLLLLLLLLLLLVLLLLRVSRKRTPPKKSLKMPKTRPKTMRMANLEPQLPRAHIDTD